LAFGGASEQIGLIDVRSRTIRGYLDQSGFATHPRPVSFGFGLPCFNPAGSGPCAVSRSVSSLAFNPDGSLLASSREVWDVRSGRVLRTISVGEPLFSPDGEWLVFFSGRNVTLQQTAVEGSVHTLVAPSEVLEVSCSSDDCMALTAGDTGVPPQLIGVRSGTVVGPQPRLPEFAEGDKRVLLRTHKYQVLEVFNVTRNQHEAQLQANGLSSRPFFSTDGRWVVFKEGSGAVRLWNTVTGNAVGLLSENGFELRTHPVFSADSRWVAFGSYDHFVRLFQIPTERGR
jgi:WD40 repeat protein